MLQIICSLIIILLIILLFQYVNTNKSNKLEAFNSNRAKYALLENNTCPFEYITFAEHDNGYQVKSKLKSESESEPTLYFETIEEFKTIWDNLSKQFPNLNKCGNPYEKYLETKIELKSIAPKINSELNIK